MTRLPDPSETQAVARPPFVAVGVTLVVVLAGILGVRLLLRRDDPAPVAPVPQPRHPVRPDIPPTGNDELDRMLKEAQDSVRAADEAVRRAEDRDRRIQADLAEAIARKAAADRAAAAAMNAPR